MITTYYIETSIPSFYYDTRANIQAQAMREWTREWWHKPKKNTLLLVGAPVIAELSKTPEPKGEKALQLIKDVFLLDYEESIDEIVTAYIRHKLMPAEAMGDAAHLALASFHKCDFLVTWNC